MLDFDPDYRELSVRHAAISAYMLGSEGVAGAGVVNPFENDSNSVTLEVRGWVIVER